MKIFTKRVITLCGKRTSLRLFEAEWQTLENICRRENMRRNALLTMIASHKAEEIGFTAAVRLFMLTYLHKMLPQFPFAPATSETNILGLLKTMK